ncbi:MAG: metallophosphoesterase family protein [Leptolyngbyaceae bacterium]|nr:metallophosphoesterase family protein [Leptolyngbyaceae bacterium]
MSDGRRIIIGDVHGHYNGLMRLLDAIAPTEADQVYFLGDLIDRGPGSAQVLEFVRSSGYTSLLGNHEQLLLESFPNGQRNDSAFHAWLYSGGQSTLASYEDLSVLPEQLGWLKTLPTHLDLGNIWLVHAGVHPELPIDEQTMQEFCWIRDPFHSCTQPYFADKLILTGHTITFTFPKVPPGSVVKGAGWLDIDTGAYHPKSGWLSALEINTHAELTDDILAEQTMYQVNVFKSEVRSRPLGELVVPVGPNHVRQRRRQLNQLSVSSSR